MFSIVMGTRVLLLTPKVTKRGGGISIFPHTPFKRRRGYNRPSTPQMLECRQ